MTEEEMEERLRFVRQCLREGDLMRLADREEEFFENDELRRAIEQDPEVGQFMERIRRFLSRD